MDDQAVRAQCPEFQSFEREGLHILMTHIAGRPPHYAEPVLAILEKQVPAILACGHTHMLQVMHDPRYSPLLYLNPGAAGKHGSHQVRTLLRFEINQGKVSNMQAIELGLRATITS